MKYREFYEQIREITQTTIDNNLLYEIDTEYQPRHKEILSLINEIDRTQNKYHENFKHSYLPKTLSFIEVVEYAVVTTTTRFINENKKYQEELKNLSKGTYIGYWTTVKKVIFYTEDQQSLGQFVVPKKGLLIPQSKAIEIIEKNSIRQRRSDSKYHDLVEAGEIEIEGEILPKKIFREKYITNITK